MLLTAYSKLNWMSFSLGSWLKMGTLELRSELHQPGQKSLSWPPGKNSFFLAITYNCHLYWGGLFCKLKGTTNELSLSECNFFKLHLEKKLTLVLVIQNLYLACVRWMRFYYHTCARFKITSGILRELWIVILYFPQDTECSWWEGPADPGIDCCGSEEIWLPWGQCRGEWSWFMPEVPVGLEMAL